MAFAYLSIGSNVGNKKANCEKILKLLVEDKSVSILKCSSFYLTAPVGGPPQEEYLNGVVKIQTSMPPARLLKLLKTFEKEMGRGPTKKNHPRIIDIDILIYDDMVIKTKDINVPHPRMHRRFFVLHGLNEIEPNLMHPTLDKTVVELYDKIKGRKGAKLAGRI